MNEAQIIKWLVIVVVAFTVIASVSTLFYLRWLREKVRSHRDIQRLHLT